jgi:transcriptional regulator with XRE-family HTH domain
MFFSDLLREELARRRGGNPRYSLRAFARRLEIDHATLSQLLRGRRRLSTRTIALLGARIGLGIAAIRECSAAENDARVLRVVRHPSFRPDSRWIAVRTGLPLDEVNISLQRLLHGRVLTMTSRTAWTCER